jgi:hypothetical protein
MRAGLALFKDRVRPALLQHCAECHVGPSKKGDFDLSTRESLFDSGQVGESADDSHLLQLVRHEDEPHMPHKAEKLPEETIDVIARWIDLGAPYDKSLSDDDLPEARASGIDIDRRLWSLQPLSRPHPPDVRDKDWCRTDVDRFILSQLEQHGLTPNSTADRRTLLRRAYFDLIGLPPTPAELDEFVNDRDPAAYARRIDRLLASPHYGERWARHWMDVARFAESSGFEHDDDRPNAYHYRDFLIRSFNGDLSYRDFVRWQIAGDELAADQSQAVVATGFLGAGVFPTQLTEAEFERCRYDEIDDMVATTGVAFLGLSIGCARCHDHKFDPISSHDYYRIAAAFAKTVRSEIDLALEPSANAVKVQVTGDGLPPIKNHAHDRGYPYHYDQVYFLKRGDVEQKNGVARPGFLQVLMRGGKDESHWAIAPPANWTRSEFRRAALANWMTDTESGAGHLAARVMANRVWQHHIGRGIVSTPNDFGWQGERPTHPELLDWLAAELIAGDWKLKRLHRLIMTSSVYMQAGDNDPDNAKIDPSDRYHWRRLPLRLESESIRDAMLSVAGILDETMYGPGSLDPDMRRRSIYFTIKRSRLIPMMMLFDWPEHLVSIGQRATTTTAPQALMFMNSPQARTCAEHFAQRITGKAILGDQESDFFSQAIRQAYLVAFGRLASDREYQQAMIFLESQSQIYRTAENPCPERMALVDFCVALMSSNEFIYLR